jgi:hypothetical protein
MAQTEQKIHKLKYPGAIDADGHILESPSAGSCTARKNTEPTRFV